LTAGPKATDGGAMTGMPQRELNDEDRLQWLCLLRSQNVGPMIFRQLLAHFGSAGEALAALPDLARRGGRKGNIRLCSRAAAEDELAAVARLGARLIAYCEAAYPPALAALEDSPPLLTVLGEAALLRRPAIGVVGARNASANGRRLAGELSADLGKGGFLVVSGMARGIDAAAHAGALASGTAAVVAGGVDVVYPRENQPLYDDILARGVVVSEMPPGLQPQARHFPRRNRIISGLALGVLVVEAAPRSGSLITARVAADQGREVFAVPGSPLDPRARGGNDLIRQGATLVETAADVIEALGPAVAGGMTEPAGGYDPAVAKAAPAGELERARRAVEELLGPSPASLDEIIRLSGLAPALVNLVLLELELAGRLERHPGNRVALLYSPSADGE